jgi:hypothetical protein
MWICIYRGKTGKFIAGMHRHTTKEQAIDRGLGTYHKAFVKAVFVDIGELI